MVGFWASWCLATRSSAVRPPVRWWSWNVRIIAAVIIAWTAAGSVPANAERATFRTYAADQGLVSLGGACMAQDRAGYILVCTEHGLFTYDGRRFVNLGTAQGLRQGGQVYDVALSASGAIAVKYADEIFVSDAASDTGHPPSALTFRQVGHPGVALYDARSNQMVAWHDGFALLAADTTELISLADGAAHLDSIRYSQEERTLLKGAESLFAVQGHLWEAFVDGRLCAADPGAVRCYAGNDGLRNGPWVDVVSGPDGRVFARSPTAVATLDPASDTWTVADLPDQGGRYDAYVPDLALFRTPDGGLMTQAEHGLAVLTANGWVPLSVEDGAPAGTIVGAMVDHTGQFWFQVTGRGLLRWVGYGHWEAVQKADGLSDGFPWQTARAPGGPLWISTDTGVDEVTRRGGALHVTKVYPGSSFAIAVGPRGRLWRSAPDGVRIDDPAKGTETRLDVPLISAINACPGNAMWLGTQAGLFKADDTDDVKLHAVLQSYPRAQVVSILCDGFGGVFYISSGHLRHRRPDGNDVPVSGEWPADGFEPLALALGRNGGIWVGGLGGLYLMTVAGDQVTSYIPVTAAETRTNSITAAIVDHRGWVWAGTSEGVSVFNGSRWVSVDADAGLISDDVDEGGLREDPDGSIWITTTQGVSHLLDPTWLFSDRPLKAVVSSAQLGSRPVLGRPLPYTTEALALQFGTPNYGAERSVLFRYRLSGVDDTEVESATGLVRYAFVPPGRHLLTVVAYDSLTHQSSPPASLVVDVQFPWWRQWWAETLGVFAVAGLGYGLIWLRFRAMVNRENELKRRVALATEQLRYDRLTGLLNRSEIESRLAEKLSHGSDCDEMIVALLDIDHFKRVNDSYGHLGGDDVLRAIGRLVSKTIWDGEHAGRYGGEEILLVLDDTDGRGAERVLELLHAVRGSSFNAAGRAVRITCSIGLAWAMHGDDWESLIGRADDALYEAKASGRDQVVERPRGVQVVRTATNDRRARPGGD